MIHSRKESINEYKNGVFSRHNHNKSTDEIERQNMPIFNSVHDLK